MHTCTCTCPFLFFLCVVDQQERYRSRMEGCCMKPTMSLSHSRPSSIAISFTIRRFMHSIVLFLKMSPCVGITENMLCGSRKPTFVPPYSKLALSLLSQTCTILLLFKCNPHQVLWSWTCSHQSKYSLTTTPFQQLFDHT